MSRLSPAKSADLLPPVIEAVRAAGSMIRAEFHRAGDPRGRGSHADIDGEVEAFLKERLRSLHPCSWLGEETAAETVDCADTWAVDPQDGTTDFLAGRRGSAVSVALLRRRPVVPGTPTLATCPVLGVVHAPLAPDDGGDLIAWARDTRLTRNGARVPPPKAGPQTIVALNADAADYALRNHVAFGGMRIRSVPSPAYRLALAAAGEVDAAVSLTAGLAPWDIAGGHALLHGAGRTLRDRHGQPIGYGNAGSFDGCIGGPADLVERLVALKPGGGRAEPRHPARPSRRIADAALLARAQGCLLGQLAGDALGSAVEFLAAADIRRRHPRGVTVLADGGTWNLIAGQPTDDSEMALALARTLVAQRLFDADAIARAYVAWHRSGPFDIGITTANAMRALAAGRRAESDSQSNGALMRASPIGIFAAGKPGLAARLAIADAQLTHPHPICGAANAVYAAAIAAGLAGAGPQTMWEQARRHAGDDDAAGETVRARLDRARQRAPDDFQNQMGWVLTTLQNAFYQLLREDTLAQAVSATVARGGDTDTNAAVCGALLGAVQGRDAVPLQWRNAMLTCRPVAAPGVTHPRPSDYWPDDALELAEALLAAGGA